MTCNLLVRSNFVSCVVIRSRHRQTALASLANCCLGLAPVAFLSQIIRCTVVYSFTALILVLALSLCLHCSLGLDILVMLSTWLNRGHFEVPIVKVSDNNRSSSQSNSVCASKISSAVQKAKLKQSYLITNICQVV